MIAAATSSREDRAVKVLVAEEDDIAREFLAENVARHIFALLWPDWLCARPRDGAAVHGGRQRRSGQVGHIRIRVTRAS
jgi:hypothetical protein